RDESPKCKCLTFSHDGNLLAWISDSDIKVIKLPEGEIVHQFPAGYSNSLAFSPKHSFLATWGPYRISDKAPQGTHNLVIWNLASGEKSAGFIHKRHTDWKPLWSTDEEICTRVVVDGVLVLKGSDIGTSIAKLSQDGIQEFSLSPSTNPIRFATFNPTKKGAPAYVKMYNFPNFDRPVCQKSFYKADNVSMSWNKTGKSLLLHASTESDKTGSSYYGEQSLYFLDDEGNSIHVSLAKTGPIYSVEWSPNGREFCVVYGSMPAKATLYNLKCDPIHEFGSSYRNLIYFNPQGTIICLAGFGNLKGEMEFWNRQDLKLISKFQASDSTQFEWSPDGQYFATATTAPRLRQGNGYKIWHYSGSLLHEVQVIKPKEELWEVTTVILS
ncbi:uncharacterized protein TRIADDRAFT_18281, partial [Trichoplax adhaerens]